MSEFTLHPKAPYNFKWNAMFFGHFKNDVVDVWTPPNMKSSGNYCRAFEIEEGTCLVRVSQVGDVDTPKLNVKILKGEHNKKIHEIISKIFRVNDELKDFYHIAKKDGIMSHLVRRFYGLKPTRTPSIFEMVIIAISEQQVSLSAAVTLRSRLAQRFGKRIEYQNKTYYTFPSAKKLAHASIDDLRALSFPRRKAEAIIKVAQIQVNGEINFEKLHSLSNEDIMEVLLKIPGIGRWSAEYILARGLGRLDVYPKNDLSVRRAVSYFYNNGNILTSSEVEKILSRFHPFERYAEYYILVAHEIKGYQIKLI